MKIIINNNRCKLIAGVPILNKLKKEPLMCIRVPGAFFSPAFQKQRWDGKFRFIKDDGTFDTGKLPQVLNYLETYGKKPELVDERELIKPKYIVNRLRGYTLRKYQKEAQLAILNNKVGGLLFPMGFYKAATNAGKTLIAASIHRAYSSKTLFIINSTELLEESLKELPQYLPGEVGYITSKGIEWNNFMVIMVKTAVNKIHTIIPKLKDYKVCIVDEADLATSKTYTKFMQYLFHCPVRIGLSGTQFSKLAKDKIKREKIRGMFGENIFEITNKELIELGHSSKVQVTIVDGNMEVIGRKGFWKDEYDAGITHNQKRHDRILYRVDHHLALGNLPMLIFCQFHEHIKQLYHHLLHHFSKHQQFEDLKIDWIHHERDNRKEIVRKFREGEIDILVGSMVLKRGKNFPLTRYILNAGGGDSFTNVLQGPIGRAVRKHASKDLTYIEDMYDQGLYLKRHSKHRRIAYRNEGFKVIDQFTIK
jgi:superfamily II DNA or RNA helicase